MKGLYMRKSAIRTIAVTGATIGALTVGSALTSSSAVASTPGTSVQKQVDDQIRRHGGKQTSPGEVSYNAGAVKLVIPGASARAGTPNCPGGWYCFYESEFYEGRRLQFQDCGTNQSLTDYGFGNSASSWHNNSTNTVEVYDRDVTPFVTLWREGPISSASAVGATFDDRADFFYTYCGT
ncbi:hypothetical protein GCM10010182_82460 [Actinomadura cremea]|nr:hypothetical protein GCM10010182_82460 [Actinomadura cremea]